MSKKNKEELLVLANQIVDILKETSNPYTKLEMSINSIQMTSVDWSEPTEEWN